MHIKKITHNPISSDAHTHKGVFAKTTSFLYLFILIGIITLSIGFALTGKFIKLLTTSHFVHESFSLLLLDRGDSIIHVDSTSKKIYSLAIKENVSYLSTPESASFYLGFPINGVIVCDRKVEVRSTMKETMSFSELLFLLKDSSCIFNGVNKYDLAKMFIVGQLASSTIHDTLLGVPDMEKVASDDFREKFGQNFRDSKIVNEDLTVHIVNASDIDGIGNQFSQHLRNAGFNIVSVTSASLQQESSLRLYNDQKKYSSEFLTSLVGMPIENSDHSAIADVVITIGRDYVEEVLGVKSRVEESKF